MERKELYAKINEFDLKDSIREEFGVSYTNLPNATLKDIVNKAIELQHRNDNRGCNCKHGADFDVDFDINIHELPITICSQPLQRLVEVLTKKRILLKSESDYILEDIVVINK